LRENGVYVDALAIRYDHARWVREFLVNAPPGSPAHSFYYQRILDGPAHDLARAKPLG
jgi:hypothetical protein